ncbi:MAG: hypothetical protein HC806_06855 [Anaerolineae bacterium]|nr:hypothetical protein [Anaerolineae bacterium]
MGIDNSLHPCDPSKVVLNFSSVTLPHRLRTLLAFGLDFCLPVYRINFSTYYLGFERLISGVRRLGTTSDQMEAINSIKGLAHKFYHGFNKSKVFSSIIQAGDIALLKSFGMRQDIVVCRPDKGKGVVVLDRSRYLKSMMTVLSDVDRFREVKESIQSYTLRAEDRINRFLREMLTKKIIERDTYQQLTASGSAPGILYGLPKIHKPDFAANHQCRPIFAAYNIPSYKLASFLVPKLSELTKNEYTLENSKEFSQTIINVPDSSNFFMCSFDVSNLFTNVPIHETINIICQQLFKVNGDTYLNMNLRTFKKLLELSVLNSFFIFNNILYNQFEGLGMGLPLGPTFANIFMCFNEKIWLDQCPANIKPFLYRRYVDDCFLLFKNRDMAYDFLKYLNSRHPNIKFTIEEEKSSCLPFLDTLVHKGSSFSTSVFRKGTFTGLGMSFFSFCTHKFKLNSLMTLIARGYTVSSTYHFSIQK